MALHLPQITSPDTSYKWFFLLFVNICIVTLCIFCAKNHYLPFTNEFIPDATFYEDHVMLGIDRGLSNGFTEINRVLYFLGPQSFLIYNTLLMMGCVYLCNLFQFFSPKAVNWAKAIIIFNPYLLISLVGPSKECNLTFLSLLSIYLFVKKSWSLKVLGILVVGVIMVIRPQFALILLLSFVMYPLLTLFKNTMLLCALILAAFFILNAIPPVNEFIVESQGGDDLPFFKSSSIYELAIILQIMSSHPLLQFPAFAAKTCLILFTPIARPNSLMSSFIPLLDWGYTFMANLLFPLNFGFIVLFFTPKLVKRPLVDRRVQFIILYIFAGMMSVIISPSIQFRYLFPYSPCIAACFTLHPLKIRNRILTISLVFSLVFFVLTAIWLQRDWSGEEVGGPFYLSWL